MNEKQRIYLQEEIDRIFENYSDKTIIGDNRVSQVLHLDNKDIIINEIIAAIEGAKDIK